MKKLLAILIFLVSVTGCKVIDEIKKELYVKITTIPPDEKMIGQTIAVLYGDVSDDGGKIITEKGIVLSRNPNPTINDTKIISGYKMFDSSPTGMGKISVLAENIIANTKYYYKAYCINSLGTSYGVEYSFTTKDLETPKLTTELNGSTTNSISVKAILTNTDLIGSIISYGFYYSLQTGVKDTDPYVLSSNNNRVNTNTTFTSTIPSLLDGTNYYIKSFVKTSRGITFGPEITVKTQESPVRIALKSGLQVFYPFSGNGNDAGSSGFNGVVSGAILTSDRFGLANSAYYFDGLVGKNIITNYYGVSGYKSRSISFWFKIPNNSIGNHSHILTYGGNPFSGENYFSIFVSSLGASKPYIGIMSGGYVGNQFAAIQDNNWHHCVVTLDEAALGALTSIKMYLDSKSVSFDVSYLPNKINNLSTLPLVLGQFTSLTNDPRPFKGSIDDLGIWNRVLTEAEIQYLYNNNYRP